MRDRYYHNNFQQHQQHQQQQHRPDHYASMPQQPQHAPNRAHIPQMPMREDFPQDMHRQQHQQQHFQHGAPAPHHHHQNRRYYNDSSPPPAHQGPPHRHMRRSPSPPPPMHYRGYQHRQHRSYYRRNHHNRGRYSPHLRYSSDDSRSPSPNMRRRGYRYRSPSSSPSPEPAKPPKISPPRVTKDHIYALDKKLKARAAAEAMKMKKKSEVSPPLTLGDVNRLQQTLEAQLNDPELNAAQKNEENSSSPAPQVEKEESEATPAATPNNNADASRATSQPPSAMGIGASQPVPQTQLTPSSQKLSVSPYPQPSPVPQPKEPPKPMTTLDLIREYLTTAQKDTVTFLSNARMFVVESDSENDIHKAIKYGVWSCTEPRLNEQLADDFSKGLPTYLLFRCKGTNLFYGIALIISQFHSEYVFPLFDHQRRGTFYIEWKLVKDIPAVNFRNIHSTRGGMHFFLHNAIEGCNLGGSDLHSILKTWKAVKSPIGRFPSLFDIWEDFERIEPSIWRDRNVQQESVPAKQFSYIPIERLRAEAEGPVLVANGTTQVVDERRGRNYFTDSVYATTSGAAAAHHNQEDNDAMVDSVSTSDNVPPVTQQQLAQPKTKAIASSELDDMSEDEDSSSSSDGITDSTILKSAFKVFPSSSLFKGCTFLTDSVGIDAAFLAKVLKAHGAKVLSSAPRDARSWAKVSHVITTQEHFDSDKGAVAQAKKAKNVEFVNIRWIITTLAGKLKVDSKFFQLKVTAPAEDEDEEEEEEDVEEVKAAIDADDVYNTKRTGNMTALRKVFSSVIEKLTSGKEGASDAKFYTFIRTEDKDAAKYISNKVKAHGTQNATKTYRLRNKYGKDYVSEQWNLKSGRIKVLGLLKRWSAQSKFSLDLAEMEKEARNALRKSAPEEAKKVAPKASSAQAASKTAIIVAKPPSFTKIRKNQYIGRTKEVLHAKEKEVHQCHCLPHIIMKSEFDPSRGDKHCGDQCENRLSNFECTANDTKHGKCENKRFQQKQWIKHEVKPTPMKGFGLFSKQDVDEEGFIMEYVGEIIDDEELEARKERYAAEGRPHYYFISLEGNMTIDATQKGCNARFINHSCDPNCETQKWTIGRQSVIGIFAIKDIKKGDELSFDYGFERFGGVGQKCYCGSANCRGVIQAKKKDKSAARLSRRKNLKNSFHQIVEKIVLKDTLSRSDYKKGKKNGNPVFMWRNLKRGFKRVVKQVETIEEQLTFEQRQEQREKEEIEKLQHSLQITPIEARRLYRDMQAEAEKAKENSKKSGKKGAPKKSTTVKEVTTTTTRRKTRKETTTTTTIELSSGGSSTDTEEEEPPPPSPKPSRSRQRTRITVQPAEQKPKSVSSKSSARGRRNVIDSDEEEAPQTKEEAKQDKQQSKQTKEKPKVESEIVGSTERTPQQVPPKEDDKMEVDTEVAEPASKPRRKISRNKNSKATLVNGEANGDAPPAPAATEDAMETDDTTAESTTESKSDAKGTNSAKEGSKKRKRVALTAPTERKVRRRVQ